MILHIHHRVRMILVGRHPTKLWLWVHPIIHLISLIMHVSMLLILIPMTSPFATVLLYWNCTLDNLLRQKLHEILVSLLHLFHYELEVFVLFLALFELPESIFMAELFIFQFGPVSRKIILVIQLFHLVLTLLSRFILLDLQCFAVPYLTIGLLDRVHRIAAIYIVDDGKILLDRYIFYLAKTTEVILEIRFFELTREIFDENGTFL